MPCEAGVYGSIFCSGFVVNIDIMFKVQFYVAYCRYFYVYSMITALHHH